jgi:hypothetical protein
VAHLRDMRSELLLKLVLADQCGIDIAEMLEQQRRQVSVLGEALAEQAAGGVDVIAVWRHQSAAATLAFLEIVMAGNSR